jgi:competence protein ComEC
MWRHIVNWLKQHPLLTLISALFLLDGLLFYSYLCHREHGLIVAFLDIGQGDAVFVEAPNGNQLLYDAGPPSGAVLSALSDVMPFYDRSIDVAVLSHPDMDHIGGFADVFTRYDVDVLLESGASSTNGVFDVVEERIVTHHIPRFIAKRGMIIDLGDGVFADILYPDRDTTGMETNSASIVMRLRYGSTSFLFSGDLPQPEEDHLVSLDGRSLRSEILKLGHHGSRTSSSGRWLRAVSPSVAIVSAGKDNRYGHPHKEVTDTLSSLGVPLLITWQEGTIVFMSDGRTVTRTD